MLNFRVDIDRPVGIYNREVPAQPLFHSSVSDYVSIAFCSLLFFSGLFVLFWVH